MYEKINITRDRFWGKNWAVSCILRRTQYCKKSKKIKNRVVNNWSKNINKVVNQKSKISKSDDKKIDKIKLKNLIHPTFVKKS